MVPQVCVAILKTGTAREVLSLFFDSQNVKGGLNSARQPHKTQVGRPIARGDPALNLTVDSFIGFVWVGVLIVPDLIPSLLPIFTSADHLEGLDDFNSRPPAKLIGRVHCR